MWLSLLEGHAQGVPHLSDDSYISVLSILPGKPLYSAFGHTAIRVRDDSLGIDAVYNFGTFDFDTDWFYLKFARGLLDYRLARNRFEDVLDAYTEEQRPIIEQRLAFDETQRQTLVLRLEHNYLPENRNYRYDFFFDNCSTRPRDVIESAAGRQALGGLTGSGRTFRELIDPYIRIRPWTDFGIDILLGARTDRPATDRERLFLPDELMTALDTVKVGRSPMVSESDTLFWPREYERRTSSPLFGPTLVLALLLVYGIAIATSDLRRHPASRYFDAFVFLFAGLAGVVILFLWFGTQHTVTRDNWNILWALPTHLVAAVAVLKKFEGRVWRFYLWTSTFPAALVFIVWASGVQDFHFGVIPLILLLIVRLLDRARSAALVALLLFFPIMSQAQPERSPIRSYGFYPGVLEPGPSNAITDVGGVAVGHVTLDQGDSVRTGATAILPHTGNIFEHKVPAAIVVGNGFGKLAGITQVRELGEIETPIILTNTLAVSRGIEAILDHTLSRPGNENVRSVNAVVGETNDGYLNDIRARALTPAHIRQAIDSASSDPPQQGSVGAGRGTVAFGWKGGIGTSSRILPGDLGGYTVGVLVQSNYGGILQILGVEVGRELGQYYLKDAVEDLGSSPDGSIIVVVATDAPLSDRNLERLATRALAGLARTGSSMSNGSGDYVIAFSTAESVRRTSTAPRTPRRIDELPNNRMSPLFQAVIEATEEAIYNSLFMASTGSGHRGTIEALPVDRVLELLHEQRE